MKINYSIFPKSIHKSIISHIFIQVGSQTKCRHLKLYLNEVLVDNFTHPYILNELRNTQYENQLDRNIGKIITNTIRFLDDSQNSFAFDEIISAYHEVGFDEVNLLNIVKKSVNFYFLENYATKFDKTWKNQDLIHLIKIKNDNINEFVPIIDKLQDLGASLNRQIIDMYNIDNPKLFLEWLKLNLNYDIQS